ncbi:hypothetical protein RDI58_029001 [Solanum bulbocastanum]|uniref:Uncharacterized protein n=1 Tax=Solanum bulbocastanum TaxID=147425 RepID=A0AAN8SR14_SOLBU
MSMGDQPPTGVGVSRKSTMPANSTIINDSVPTNNNYANALTIIHQTSELINLKPITLLHGEPIIIWTKKESDGLSIRQNLQFAVVAKFSYGRPDLYKLRKAIPIQLEIKGPNNIGFLEE